MGAYLAIRESAPKADQETVLWVGLAALAIQNERLSRGQSFRLETALKLSSFAAGLLPRDSVTSAVHEYLGSQALAPDAVTLKADLDALLLRANVQRNKATLSVLK